MLEGQLPPLVEILLRSPLVDEGGTRKEVKSILGHLSVRRYSELSGGGARSGRPRGFR